MLRLGLLIDGAELRLFDAELVRRIQAAKIATVVLVVRQQLPARTPLFRALRALKRGKLIRSVLFNAAVWLERQILGLRKPEIEDLFRYVPVDQVCTAETLSVEPVVSRSGYVHRFSAADVEAIRSRKLDLLLRLGSGILRGDILGAASRGILSFHHGDNRTHRGQLPGYWEVVERRDLTGFIVQKLTEALDAGEVLVRGEVATQATYLLNQYHLFRSSITSMIDLLGRMDRNEEGVGAAGSAQPADWYSNVVYTTPSAAQTLMYVARFVRQILRRGVRAALIRRGVWELRLLDGDWRSLVAAKARRLIPPRGRFWADPFIVGDAGGKVIFFEEYEFERSKGHIAALVSTANGSFSYAGPVIKTPYHLSFPYVFRYQGEYYMCPETFEARAIQLWRCTSWPLKWKYCKTLLADIDTVDTMIFEHDGRWWLFTNPDRDGTGDHCRELHVYHADSPLSDKWTPLSANPVVTGAGRARNAGILSRDGKIYRLAQCQGFDLYGRSLKLFEITALSEQGYSEKLISELLPSRGLDALGFHHLSACDGTVVFDAYRLRQLWTRLLSPSLMRDALWPLRRSGTPAEGSQNPGILP